MKYLLSAIIALSCSLSKAQLPSNSTLATVISEVNKLRVSFDSIRKDYNSQPVLRKTDYKVIAMEAQLIYPKDNASKDRIDSIVISDRIVHKADDNRHNYLLTKTSATDTLVLSIKEQIGSISELVRILEESIMEGVVMDSEIKEQYRLLIESLNQIGINFINLK